AGDEEERQAAFLDHVRDRIDPIAADIDVEDREVEHAGHATSAGILDRACLQNHVMPKFFHHGHQSHADQHFIFDYEYRSLRGHAETSLCRKVFAEDYVTRSV